MLQNIRDQAQTWVMWTIVILLIIPFAFWGIHEYFSGPSEVVIARVNDREIGLQEFQQAYHQQRVRLQQLLGARFDADRIDEARLKDETLDRLVNDELVLQTAHAGGLRVADEHLVAAIRSVDAFQVGGQFSQEQYERALRSQGFLPGTFEQSFRRSLLNDQLHAGVAGSAIVTGLDLGNVVRLAEQKRSFEYLRLPAAGFASEVNVSDEEGRAYFEAHAAQYVNPEEVRIEYLELSRKEAAGAEEVTDDEIQRRYEANKATFFTPEQRQASHILLSLPADASADAVKAAMDRARDLRARVQPGESFGELAKVESQDPGSAAQGGDLGYFSRGMMVPVFEEAAFGMKEGEISEPVRSDFGVHLIQLTGIRPAAGKPLEAVRDQLRQEIQYEKAEKAYFERAEQLANLTYENPDTLEVAAGALGIAVQASDFFKRTGGSGIAADLKVVRTAFSDDVLGQGRNSEAMELGDRIVVLRVKEHRPETRRGFEEVRDEVLARVRADKLREKARSAGEDLLKRLQAGEDPEAVAQAAKVPWAKQESVGRTAVDVDPVLLQAVFALGRPQGDRPLLGSTTLAEGDFVVLRLMAVSDGEVAAAPAETRQALEDRLKRAQGAAAFEALVESVRARADVKLFKERL
jgi:peptidyl-prolyl cis-trans isomerase D